MAEQIETRELKKKKKWERDREKIIRGWITQDSTTTNEQLKSICCLFYVLISLFFSLFNISKASFIDCLSPNYNLDSLFSQNGLLSS
jgi:hypothetical protein